MSNTEPKKRVTNADIYREIGEIQIMVKDLRETVAGLGPRIGALEQFKSYITGGAAVIAGLGISTVAAVKGVFGIHG
jgi:hypothetical protein